MAADHCNLKRRWHAGRLVPPRQPYVPLPPSPPKVRQHRKKQHPPISVKTLLHIFRLKAFRSKNRIELLRRYAEIRVQTKASYQSRREGSLPLKAGIEAHCFACQRFRLVHRHHIIQVQYGGPNTKKNLVYLCVYCHGEVHPWMRETAPDPRVHPPMWA